MQIELLIDYSAHLHFNISLAKIYFPNSSIVPLSVNKSNRGSSHNATADILTMEISYSDSGSLAVVTSIIPGGKYQAEKLQTINEHVYSCIRDKLLCVCVIITYIPLPVLKFLVMPTGSAILGTLAICLVEEMAFFK